VHDRTKTDREFATRIAPALTVPYGRDELHGVFFEPREERGGPRPCVCIQIPEAGEAGVRTAVAELIGFHFRKSIEEGTQYGRKIGERTITNYLQPVL
jgi:hypothetical protein